MKKEVKDAVDNTTDEQKTPEPEIEYNEVAFVMAQSGGSWELRKITFNSKAKLIKNVTVMRKDDDKYQIQEELIMMIEDSF